MGADRIPRMRWRVLRGCFLVLIFVAGVTSVQYYLTREPDLLSAALLVANTSGWGAGSRFNTSSGIHWLSDDEVMFARFEGESPKNPNAIRDPRKRIIYTR